MTATLSILLFLLHFLACQHKQTQQKQTNNNPTHSSPNFIWAADWSSDGKYFALSGDDSTVWIYNASSHKLHKTFRANSAVKNIAWHPQKNLLAIANMKGVQLLDLNTGTITTPPDIKAGGRGLSWNNNGQLLALADGYGVVQVMDQEGKLIRSIPKQERKSYLSLHWHPKEDIIVTGGDEIILFDTSGKQLSMFRIREQYTGILSVQWHPSGEFFASGDYGHENEGKPTLLQFWKMNGTLIKQMDGHREEIRNLRWSHDGTRVATASDALRIWSREGELLHTGKSDTNLWGLAWSKDDKFILTGSFDKGQVILWNSEAGVVKKIH